MHINEHFLHKEGKCKHGRGSFQASRCSLKAKSNTNEAFKLEVLFCVRERPVHVKVNSQVVLSRQQDMLTDNLSRSQQIKEKWFRTVISPSVMSQCGWSLLPMYEVNGPINGVNNPGGTVSQLETLTCSYRLLPNEPEG